jgi:predicted nuclease of predicted toxin-antitoxin system
MRFLVDMNLSPRSVAFLAAAGHEEVHWIDAGEPNSVLFNSMGGA